jgi:hypothetical protein
VDRYDVGEFAGLAGLVVFAGLIWLPAALLVASMALLVEVNLRSRNRAPVRASVRPSRLAAAARALRSAWVEALDEDAAA